MMMISNRLSAAAARSRRTRLIGIAAVVLLVGAAALARAPLSEIVWRMAAPVMRARFSATSPSDLSRLAAAEAERDALYKENIDLKARLGRDGRVGRVLGAVLLRPPATPYDTLVIDAGFSEGVAVGDVVSAGGSVVIGTVSETYTHAARVMLYSAPGQKYDALLHSSSASAASLPLAIEGQGGGSLRAQVPSGTIVSAGDSAVLPGIAGGVSARVSRVEHAEGESFSTVYFSLPVDIFALRFVEVWKQPNHVTQ